MAELRTRIVLRHDTAAKWTEINPVLKAGELGIETDTGLMKVGNEVSTWTALDYVNKFDAVSSAAHYDVEATEGQEDLDAIAAKLAEMNAEAKLDDVAIVKREIANEKYSYTAYIHNGTKWTAMDGNYNADNIYFDQDFLVTEDIGAIKLGDGYSTTLNATGKNLSEVLTSVFAARKMPEVTPPSVTIKFLNSVKSVEAGTTITPEYECTFDPGSYSYDESTGVTANSYTVTDGTKVSPFEEGTMPEIVIGDQDGAAKTYKLSVTVDHTAGKNPHDNYGDEQPSLAIAANSALTGETKANFSCYRNYFYGALTTSSTEEPLTSDVIRTYLTAGGNYNASKVFSITASGYENPKRFVVAYPKNTNRNGLTKVDLTSYQMTIFDKNLPAEENVYKPALDVNVAGAENYAPIPYTVYVYEPPFIGEDEVHEITLG